MSKDILRKHFQLIVEERKLQIHLPLGEWSEFAYQIGPIGAEVFLRTDGASFSYDLGTYSNQANAAKIIDQMIEQYPGGYNIRYSLNAWPTITLNVDIALRPNESQQLVEFTFAELANLAIALFKIGIASGELIEPTLDTLGHFGLCAPNQSIGNPDSSSNFNKEAAGIILLYSMNAELDEPKYQKSSNEEVPKTSKNQINMGRDDLANFLRSLDDDTLSTILESGVVFQGLERELLERFEPGDSERMITIYLREHPDVMFGYDAYGYDAFFECVKCRKNIGPGAHFPCWDATNGNESIGLLCTSCLLDLIESEYFVALTPDAMWKLFEYLLEEDTERQK